MPDIQVNMISVLIAAIANFFLGFFWFSILFKKTWALEMGFNPNEELPKKELFRSLGLAMIGYFLLAYVLAHQLAVWDSESWGLGVSQWSNLERIAMLLAVLHRHGGISMFDQNVFINVVVGIKIITARRLEEALEFLG